MHNIDQVIRSISGHYDRRCYEALHLAVQLTLEALPARPLMKELALETARRCVRPMTAQAVLRALERSAADIWACGCRARLEQIYGRPLLEPPTAKNLIFTLAEYCGNGTDHTYLLTEQQLKRLLQVLR